MASSPPAVAETMMKIPLIKSCVKAIMLQDIDSQCQKLCHKKENPSVLRMIKDSEKEKISVDLYSNWNEGKSPWCTGHFVSYGIT